MKTITEEFARMWTEYINWDKREKGENGFFSKILKKYNCKTIFNTALGDGFDTIHLIESGFDVESNEIDEEYQKVAFVNATKNKLQLKVTNYDWRELTEYITKKFDALICLGNSLTYMLKKEDQIKTLKEMYSLIKEGGILIVDHRNYDYFLKEKQNILNDDFKYLNKYYYCSKSITGIPIEIEDDHVIMEYTHKIKKLKGYLKLYPLKEDEVVSLLKSVGFKKIETYYDFKKEKSTHYDFVQHIAIK